MVQWGANGDDHDLIMFQDGPSVNWLLKACSEMSDEDIVGIAAGNALMEMSNKRLLKLAEKNQPPQEYYECEEESL